MSAVCIVLVNYNSHPDTIECLESVFKSHHENYQVVVVDNSDPANSVYHLEQWARGHTTSIQTLFPELVFPLEKKPLYYRVLSEDEFLLIEQRVSEKVLFVRAKKNLGFAGGNNVAIRYFTRTNQFDFLWLLNNDTVIQKDTLSYLVECASRQLSAVGIMGGKLRQYYMRERLQAVGGKYYKWFGKVKEVGRDDRDEGQWDREEFHLDYVIGASMFARKEFVQSIGPMEEDYFLYFEELDWALRGKEKGWKMAFCPNAIVYHKLGASTGSRKVVSEISDFYFVRNRILIARKFFPLTLLTLYPGFLVFIINRIRRKVPDRIKLLFALLWNPRQHYSKKERPL